MRRITPLINWMCSRHKSKSSCSFHCIFSAPGFQWRIRDFETGSHADRQVWVEARSGIQPLLEIWGKAPGNWTALHIYAACSFSYFLNVIHLVLVIRQVHRQRKKCWRPVLLLNPPLRFLLSVANVLKQVFCTLWKFFVMPRSQLAVKLKSCTRGIVYTDLA